MRFKSLVSPLALIIGLGVTGAAVAQDAAAEAEAAWTIENGTMMINGAEITEEQSGYIQNYCTDLQDEFEDESAGEGGGGAGSEEDSADDGAEDSSDEGAEPSLEDLPTSMIDFDLSQLTRDDCVEAGFITE